jgi:curved DNA-binding protein CbpA
MRLGKEVLEADLYAELGILPDATESEVRVAYRARALASHPDLNPTDPEAPSRMARLNVAAKVLLDPALRRAYDRVPRGRKKTPSVKPPRRTAWFERGEQSGDDDWSRPSVAAPPQGLWGELRGRDGQLGLRAQALVESLTAPQQIGVAALLFAVALGLIAMAGPRGIVGDAAQPTSVHVGSVYP